MGFSEGDVQKIYRALQKQWGMVLVTGPTGSGKTTTLYSLAKILNKPDVSIVTIEDPVEYAVDGMKQININPRSGLTFAHGLRSVLRQDPDIIMVGEIRDTETAHIATHTALTGHMLLSTLHTVDASSAIPRLVDMGVEPFLISSTLTMVIAQRLVRKICPQCKTTRTLSQAQRNALMGAYGWEISSVYYGAGCDVCGRCGFVGREVLAEILEVDQHIRDVIVHSHDASHVRAVAREHGMVSIASQGLGKIMQGVTTLEEVLELLHE